MGYTVTKAEISGGYYLKARIIQEKKIMSAPPHVREIWDWLLMNANHKDNYYKTHCIKRGQLFRTYEQIQDGLCWYVGYRRAVYRKHQVKHAIKYLRDAECISSARRYGGSLITILNYNYYQNPSNYEATTKYLTKHPPEATNEATLRSGGNYFK